MSLLWDSPPGSMRAAVIIQHGFARTPQHLAGLAGAVADRGFLVVRPRVPSLRPRRSLHDEGWLDALGQEVVSAIRSRVGNLPIIAVGHSVGAAVVAGWGPDLTGLILLDPVDRYGRIDQVGRADRSREHPPLRVFSADPSSCNRHGRAALRLAAAGYIRAGSTWIRMDGTAHPDPERIPTSLSPVDVHDSDLLARLACGRGGAPTAVCRWGEMIVREIESVAR